MRRAGGPGSRPVGLFACNTCGISNFLTRAGLYSHQRYRCTRRRPVCDTFNCRATTISQVGIATNQVDVIGTHAASTNPEPLPESDEGIVNDAHTHVGDDGSGMDLPPPSLNAGGIGGSSGCPNSWISPTPARGDGTPLRPFDSDFHLVNFIRNCKNKEGLSREDMKALLDLLWDNRFDPKALTIRSPDDVGKYEEKELYSSSDGWTKYTFADVTTGDADLYYKDPIQVLTSLFSAPENGEDFKVGPTCNRTESGERIFTTPDTGYWWSQMQEYINVECDGATIAPLIFYSDQTCLSNNMRIHGYPLVMTTANISIANRREEMDHELLAVLPTFQGSKSCKITATYDTNLSTCPCSRCMCGRDALNNVDREFQVRTESKMKEVYEAMKSFPQNLADEMAKAWSLHPIQCALWGFNGGDTTMGNPYLAIHVDILHQSDLGVFKMIVGIIRDMASISPRERKLQELDRRLLYIKQNCRFPAFRIPGNEQGGYFVSQANFAGFEHRAVLQVIVLCLVGLFDDTIISAVVSFSEWYSNACRSTSHTSTSLRHMDGLMYSAVEALKGGMMDWQRSGFNTSKVHMMGHFSHCIQRSGLPWEYSTDMYEQFHIALMKSGYRSSNKRAATQQIIRHNKRLQSLRRASKQIQGVQQSVKLLETPLKKAMKMGHNIVSPVYANVHRLWFHRRGGDFGQPSRATPQDFRNGRACNLARVPVIIQKLLVDQPELPREFLNTLRTYEECNNVTISQVLGLSRSVAVPPGSGENFHGRPYFSNVAFEVQQEGCQQTCYRQIRLVFQANSQSNRPAGQEHSQVQLALLKLYTEIDDDNWSELTKCKSLRWASQASVLDVHNSMRRNSQAGLRGLYTVVDIQRILRVVHVIPNFVVPGRFFVNKWKF
ncbi:hypothetical protein M758_UG213700 [Ceratodon purpureus]|nr:hypothetical protein M758_UG213700 [Ceratodon purpureus]